ncbi:AtpZ/AtpI family protein [Mesonia aquimarina]|uniref:AtpZ/AtpI family protein n=1 Tax=Mesonia aquimarina TaxID=1504967 RepID=UPI000EF5609B|nr:AtpZ/AtpI family protein [Mesonia aquimarina]
MSEEKKNNNPKKDKPLKNWAVLSGIAIQMGVTIFLFAWGGKKIDEKYPHENDWFTILGVIFGVAISLYAVLKQLKQLNK